MEARIAKATGEALARMRDLEGKLQTTRTQLDEARTAQAALQSELQAAQAARQAAATPPRGDRQPPPSGRPREPSAAWMMAREIDEIGERPSARGRRLVGVGEAARGAAMLGLSLVQHWLLILALFELPAIMHLAQGEPGHLKGYASNLEDEPAERRTWAFMLALLVLARLHASASSAVAHGRYSSAASVALCCTARPLAL